MSRKTNQGLRAWKGNLPFESLYTAGIAGDQFFVTLRDKARIVGTRCNRCDRTYVPARQYCERCMGGLPEYIEVSNRGTVVSLTAVHVDLEGNRLEKPQEMAAVKLEGASTVLLHRLLGPSKIGGKVQVVFEAKRKGSIFDIKGFKPV